MTTGPTRSMLLTGDLDAHVGTTSSGALSAASFRSNSAREWAITISCAVGVGRRIATRREAEPVGDVDPSLQDRPQRIRVYGT